MGWVTMCMLGFLITGVNMQPLEFQVDGAEDVKDLLLDLFLEGKYVIFFNYFMNWAPISDISQ